MLKQYKNLIILSAIVLGVIVLVASDPLGYFAERRHQRALIYNRIAIERAEAEKEVAIIKASMEAELVRIRQGAR